MNDTKSQHLVELFLGNLDFLRTEMAKSYKNWWALCDDVMCRISLHLKHGLVREGKDSSMERYEPDGETLPRPCSHV